MEFFIFKLFVMNVFHPVNGAPLPHNDPCDPAIFISAIVLMAMWTLVCMVASQSGSSQLSPNRSGDDAGEGDDDSQGDEDGAMTMDNSYLMAQDDLKDHRIEIIDGSKVGSKWYVKHDHN